ncbi:MAG: methyltransferase domain-containing protein [Rhizobiales bacterium]|nr:methyltransferase domain-containing protein [Hyphomicrobiales bacterium]
MALATSPNVAKTLSRLSNSELTEAINRLGPWYYKLHVRDGIFTGSDSQVDDDGRTVAFVDPVANFEYFTKQALPNGMEGRSFLDCGCNCGGYSFAAKERGAGKVYAFDVRDHWIDQAKFLLENREQNAEDMRFEVADLVGANNIDEEFDVTWFCGLFYHLPDPVAGLKLAADKTKELLFLQTAVVGSEPGEEEYPSLDYKKEGIKASMSGIYGLSWLPSGPKVLKGILDCLGFPETRTVMWYRKNIGYGARSRGRVMIIAARERGRLKGVRNAEPIDSRIDPRSPEFGGISTPDNSVPNW